MRQVAVLDTHRIARLLKGLRDNISCYHCGKGGHVEKDCWTKGYDLAKTSDTPQKESKPIVCFNWRQEGHKSPHSSAKRKDKVK